MRLNLQGFMIFFEKEFEGNATTCANAFKVNHSTVSRIINGQKEAGWKFLKGLTNYCKKKNYDVTEYIKM